MSDLDKRLADTRHVQQTTRRTETGMSDDVTQRLAEMRGRAAAFDIADEGPAVPTEYWGLVSSGSARDVPDLLAAVEDVLALVDTAELAAPLGSPPYWTGYIRDAITVRLRGA